MGFGGLRVKEGMLSFTPHLPKKWKYLSFNINFRGRILNIGITDKTTEVNLLKGDNIQVEINGKLINCHQFKHSNT
jgi:maltose phosphorylase